MPISNIGLQEIHLDISTKLRQKTFYANEVDTEGRGLHAFLQDNGVKVDGTGVTMQFRYKSFNDGESKVYDFTPIGDPTNGEFEIHYPTEMVRGHGNKLFPCTIVANDLTSELAFENVFVYVNKAEVNTQGIEASNEYSALKQSLDKVVEVQTQMGNIDPVLMANTITVANEIVPVEAQRKIAEAEREAQKLLIQQKLDNGEFKGDTFTYTDMTPSDKQDLVSNATGQWNPEFETKYTALETEYATDLTGVKSQLADMMYYVTPEKHGAVGDGIADDTLSLQAAIDNGGVIVLSKIYKISSTLIIKKDNTRITSLNNEGTLKSAIATVYTINLNGFKNIIIDNIHFINDVVSLNSFIGGVGDSIQILSNDFKNAGIKITKSNNILLDKNKLFNELVNDNMGIYLSNTTNYTVKNNQVQGFEDGIKISNEDVLNGLNKSDHGLISDNLSILNKGDGIDVYAGGSNLIITNNRCLNNTMYGMTIKSHGTNINNEGYVKRVLVSHNLIKGSRSGLLIMANDIMILGNMIFDTLNNAISVTFGDSATPVIAMYTNIQLKNNFIDGAGMNGVMIERYADDSFLEGNVIKNCIEWGVYCTGKQLNLIGGLIQNCTLGGVRLYPYVDFYADNDYYISGTVFKHTLANTATAIESGANTKRGAITGVTVKGYNKSFGDSSNNIVGVNCNFMKISGTTAERPIKSSYAMPLQQYFDTTLNIPIFRNATNTGWVKADGTVVV